MASQNSQAMLDHRSPVSVGKHHFTALPAAILDIIWDHQAIHLPGSWLLIYPSTAGLKFTMPADPLAMTCRVMHGHMQQVAQIRARSLDRDTVTCINAQVFDFNFEDLITSYLEQPHFNNRHELGGDVDLKIHLHFHANSMDHLTESMSSTNPDVDTPNDPAVRGVWRWVLYLKGEQEALRPVRCEYVLEDLQYAEVDLLRTLMCCLKGIAAGGHPMKDLAKVIDERMHEKWPLVLLTVNEDANEMLRMREDERRRREEALQAELEQEATQEMDTGSKQREKGRESEMELEKQNEMELEAQNDLHDSEPPEDNEGDNQSVSSAEREEKAGEDDSALLGGAFTVESLARGLGASGAMTEAEREEAAIRSLLGGAFAGTEESGSEGGAGDGYGY